MSSYDVLLSHQSSDKAEVEKVARRLIEVDLSLFYVAQLWLEWPSLKQK